MATQSKPMSKSQLINHFAEKFAMPKKAVTGFFNELAELAAKETKKNDAFVLPGIGKLVKAKRKARIGRNPATGDTIKIPAKTVVKGRLSKSFKELVVPTKK